MIEGYHVPYVHPELMKLYEFNAYATEVFEHYSRQWSPLAPEDNVYSHTEGDRAAISWAARRRARAAARARALRTDESSRSLRHG